jgi:transcriptional regulator with XRE-family HTH domain
VRRNRRFSPRALRAARRCAGLSRAELAAAAGVGPAAVKAWETGARTPRPATQTRLAHALGLGYADLETTTPADPDLRGVRVAAGLTQTDAARLLGLDRSALKRVEAGAELPPDPALMGRVYGVTKAELAAAARRTGG